MSKVALATNKPTATELIRKHRGLTGLDEEGLARELVGLRHDPDLIQNVLNQLANGDRDDVGVHFTEQLSDPQLRQLAGSEPGKALLKRVMNDMNTGSVYDDEARQVQRIGGVVAQRHRRVLQDWLPSDVAQSMKTNGLDHQPIAEGNGPVNFDEYSVTVEKMPPGVTPEQFLQRLANDPNGTLQNGGFDRWVEFDRRGSDRTPARPGAIYDLDILGPDDASVVMRDQSSSHFTLTTVNGKPHGEHPIYGNREFGFRRNQDGSVTFYTLAADRMDLANGKTLAGEAGKAAQASTWNAWTEAIQETITRQGGRVRPRSRTESHALR